MSIHQGGQYVPQTQQFYMNSEPTIMPPAEQFTHIDLRDVVDETVYLPDVKREADTTQWVAFASTSHEHRRQISVRAMLAGVLCFLLAVISLAFGTVSLVLSGVDIMRYGLELAALVSGGGLTVAMIYALTDE